MMMYLLLFSSLYLVFDYASDDIVHLMTLFKRSALPIGSLASTYFFLNNFFSS